MKLLVVIGALDVGGAERHLLAVLPRLRAFGFEPAVFVLKRGGRLEPEMVAAGVGVDGVRTAGGRWWRLLRVVTALLRISVSGRGEPIHFFLPHAYLIGGMIACLCGRRPRLMSRRSLNFYQSKYPGVRWLERWLHQRMDVVVGNSEAVVRQLADEGVSADRLTLIPNGVNLETFEVAQGSREDKRTRELGIADGTLVMICVANLIAYKGHRDLLDALAIAAPSLTAPWRLLIVGRDDGIGATLLHQAETLGIDAQIDWLGSRDDVPQLLQACDFAILPSHEEGFSNSVLEAMAAGLPLLVTDVGGNPEAVVNGETGIVVPARDPQALADGIRELAADGAKRQRMGEAGLRRIRERFSLQHTVECYRQLYEGVCSPKH